MLIHVSRSVRQLVPFATMIILLPTQILRNVNYLITFFWCIHKWRLFVYSYIASDNIITSLTDIEITPRPAIIFDKLIHVDPSKSSGPEGWPTLSLKETAQQLCTPLCILFKKSLESSVLPNTRKEAFVTPIHKKGDHA